jgi:tetratricopeptide (TPR) repeat protein
MTASRPEIEAIFHAARAIRDPERRREYVRQACGGDEARMAHVEALLAAADTPDSLLDRPAGSDPVATIDQPTTESPGTVIGPYKLIEPIDEGGMGAVWMAQQTAPVKRLVAVKLIKAGMDSRQVIARFEAERQALALMDHPNIARVLDGGTTSVGRPYFVMDLVKGVPITRYCDEHHLTPRQRLELFVPVCQAVQHAHQKGIIHRDLKPSNVLVALYDGKPVPKVIDFGVAKAAGQSLTEKTLVTGFGAIVGTLEYMSPEQAEVNQLDIDTRSDIYSLGVLLYELLTGSPPFTRKELEKAGLLEMLRVIREQEPSKPSTKLSTAEGLPTLAANRGTEPAKLTRLVRGELDWIVMKALEKDRNRRYETANGFAMDVQRYLADEAVLACPPSVGYRLWKFMRRNKGPVIAVSVILLCLVAGIIGTSAGLVWAVRERDDKAKALIAETEARAKAMDSLRDLVDDIVENQMARGTTLSDENKEFLRKIIKHFEGFAALTADDAESRAIRAEGYFRVGRMHYFLGEMKEAETALADALALYKQLAVEYPNRPEFRRELARSHHILGQLFYKTDRFKEAETGYADALAIQKPLAADFPGRPEFRQELAWSHNNLGNLFKDTGRLKEAEITYADALAIQKPLAADFPGRREFREELARSHNNLGNLLRRTGRAKEAETAYADALAIRKRLAADFPNQTDFRIGLADTLNNLAELCNQSRDSKTAKARQEEAIAAYRKAIELDPKDATVHYNLGFVLFEHGNLDEAIDAYHKAIELDPKHAAAYCNLGLALRLKRKLDESIAACRKAIELDSKNANAHNILGMAFEAQGKVDDAIAAYRKAIELDPKFADPHNNLGNALGAQGKFEEAIVHFRQAIDIDPKQVTPRINMARLLATWPEPKLRDPRLAVEHAKEAVELQPKSFMALQVLGWAQYRAGAWRESVETLEKSCKLQAGGTGYAGQWIVLALAHAKLATQEGLPEQEREDHHTEARHRYEQADKQIDSWWRARPGDASGQAIWDFRIETRELMGLKGGKK